MDEIRQFKIVIIGDGAVGKTSFLKYFANSIEQENMLTNYTSMYICIYATFTYKYIMIHDQ